MHINQKKKIRGLRSAFIESVIPNIDFSSNLLADRCGQRSTRRAICLLMLVGGGSWIKNQKNVTYKPCV